MGRLFTVSWPNRARLEACLLFAALVLICAQRIPINSAFAQLLDAEAHDLGIPEALLLWTGLGVIVSAPYLGVIIIVDRLLKVRKGLALLSILAVLAWALAGAGLSRDIARLLLLDSPPAAFAWQVALLAALASAMLRAPSLWAGLSGRDIARRPPGAEPPGASRSPPAADEATRFILDPANRNAPSPVRRGVNRLVWLSILASTALGYTVFFRNLDRTDLPHSDPGTLSGMLTPPVERTPAAGLHLPDEPPPLPRVVTLGGTSPPFGAGPPQNDPSPLPRVVTSGGGASASRRKDGLFAFNALVNGKPASMLFDAGASVVAIRSEDAQRFGLPVNTLKFSIKVLTANGTGTGAAATIDTLTVGTITQHHVQAVVASPGTLNENLLGQSFLKNLRQVNVENNQVMLKAD